jgi:hypothetical protein
MEEVKNQFTSCRLVVNVLATERNFSHYFPLLAADSLLVVRITFILSIKFLGWLTCHGWTGWNAHRRQKEAFTDVIATMNEDFFLRGVQARIVRVGVPVLA